MKTFKVYFEFFGRKMHTTVQAQNEYDAMESIKKRIIFHKVEPSDPSVDALKDFFGFK